MGTPIQAGTADNQAPTSSGAGQDLARTTTSLWPSPVPRFPLRWGGSAGGQAAGKCKQPRARSHTARLVGSLNAKGQISIFTAFTPSAGAGFAPEEAKIPLRRLRGRGHECWHLQVPRCHPTQPRCTARSLPPSQGTSSSSLLPHASSTGSYQQKENQGGRRKPAHA